MAQVEITTGDILRVDAQAARKSKDWLAAA